jgi:hypothetical protein
MARPGIAVASASWGAAGQPLSLNASTPDEVDVGELSSEGAVLGLEALGELGITLVLIHRS